MTEECNDPNLCSYCSRNAEWPKCMENTELRGFHPIFPDSWDDVVECSNHECGVYENV